LRAGGHLFPLGLIRLIIDPPAPTKNINPEINKDY